MRITPTFELSLSTRILFTLSLLLLLTAGIAVTAIWYAGRFNNMLTEVAGQRLELVQTARIMETALANQKGFVTYFFLDGDPKWLKELAAHRQKFREALSTALDFQQSPPQLDILKKISRQYESYILAKDRVIELYRSGKKKEGETLHWRVREQFFALNDLCMTYRQRCEQSIHQIRVAGKDQVREVWGVAIALMVFQVLVGIFLAFKLFSQIILPIRTLSRKTTHDNEVVRSPDEVKALKHGVNNLIDNMDRTQNELQQSKEMLVNSEKMALVGKLAPVVAHSIRNPMTSINMRLFSLQRNLDLTETQKEDFQVVAEEMRRLDNIVQNYLEFSRPHKLKKEKLCISTVIDMTLELLSYRLDLYNIRVTRQAEHTGALISADPELMKEVFVNLLVNACDAMENGGDITIAEKEVVADNIGRAMMVQVIDNGPGISSEMQARVLEPFETTKPEGTGLGLFIATRIIKEHDGELQLTSNEGEGATFTIVLPVFEETS
ncbi:MAG: ATP-binding protein [Thermodesulfobacteriota bacterium]|nr:ATP-binding protein [Thermodesulfobacteriota bacterium]